MTRCGWPTLPLVGKAVVGIVNAVDPEHRELVTTNRIRRRAAGRATTDAGVERCRPVSREVMADASSSVAGVPPALDGGVGWEQALSSNHLDPARTTHLFRWEAARAQEGPRGGPRFPSPAQPAELEV